MNDLQARLTACFTTVFPKLREKEILAATMANVEGWDSLAAVMFIALADEKLGVTIHNFAELNLRNDLDGAASLTDACDLVISAPTAAAAMAGALGKEVWFMVANPSQWKWSDRRCHSIILVLY